MSLSASRRRASLATLAVLLSLAALSSADAAPTARSAAAEGSVQRLAYVTETTTGPSRVWIAAASGRDPKLLGPGQQPLLAPNGLSVAASLFGASGESEKGPAIGIYPASGGAVADYFDLETATATPLAWSPDSRYLAVARESNEVTNIAAGSGLDVLDTQTGTIASIAEGEISGASFAQDGSDRIVFAVSHSLSPSAHTNLYVSNPDGSGLKRLTDDGRSLNPLWGPHYIAFDRERLRHYAPAYQIWLESPGGGAPVRRVTNVPAGELVSGLVPLAFSADGSRLLAEFVGQDTDEAWSVNVSSGHARRVSVHGNPVIGAGISSSGNTLLIDENAFEQPPSTGRIATIPFAGGHPKVLVAHGAQASWNG